MVDSTPILKILAFGPPEVRLGERLVIFPTRKTLALLIYLATEGGMQPREHLATLLWPEASTDRSYSSLRNTLGHLHAALRQALGEVETSYLSVSHHALGLDPDANIDFDLQTVDRAYDRARNDRSSRKLPEGSASLPLLQSAAACQRGDFLAGFSLGDAPGIDDWAAIQREAWHRRLGLVLDRLSEIQFARGDFAGATETASQWIALHTLNEIAYRRKMRAHFSAGERGQALETYEACHAALASDLGIEPEPDTSALAERIRTQTRPRLPLSNRSAPGPHGPDTSVDFLGNLFTGRVAELQTLEQSYVRAIAGKPQLVVLHGEAGIGKTRLASRFLAWASEQGAELLRGSAFESGSHLPFQPLVEALRWRIEHEQSLGEFLDDVWLSPLSQLLPELRERYPALHLTTQDHGVREVKVTQSQIFESLVQMTLGLAKQAPLVIFMDDMQWTDNTTLNLLHYAIRRWKESMTRILLLTSLRSEALHPLTQPQQTGSPQGLGQWLARVTRELTPVHIDLEPLGEQESVKMVLSILRPPAADFAQWLYDETHGQPFYLMETLKDLVERQALRPKRQKEGHWTFSVDAEHDLGQTVRVPSTVYAVIRSRLNRLSPNGLSLLAAGAVLERDLLFEHLCAVAKVTEDLALPALDELISSRLFLEASQSGVLGAYTFVNEMIRDVVYTEAGDARRRLFHRRALDILEAAGDSAAVLAHHALVAELAQATYRHSLAAGREALRISAVSEAIVHFERAHQMVQDGSLSEIPDEADLRDLEIHLGLSKPD